MASLTSTQFIIELDKFADEEVPETVLEITQKLALQGLRGVVLKSPVDTGRFMGNWTVAAERVSLSTTTKVDKTGGSTINKGSALIFQLKPYQRVFISNNLPYALVLEFGGLNRRPNAMVALTAAELEILFE